MLWALPLLLLLLLVVLDPAVGATGASPLFVGGEGGIFRVLFRLFLTEASEGFLGLLLVDIVVDYK